MPLEATFALFNFLSSVPTLQLY